MISRFSFKKQPCRFIPFIADQGGEKRTDETRSRHKTAIEKSASEKFPSNIISINSFIWAVGSEILRQILVFAAFCGNPFFMASNSERSCLFSGVLDFRRASVEEIWHASIPFASTTVSVHWWQSV